MANYLLLYSGGVMPEDEVEMKKGLQDWTDWYTRLGKAVVDEGKPFTPQARCITSNGKISEGTVDCMASGYAIVKADSLEAAVKMARSCPILKSESSISVYETMDMMM